MILGPKFFERKTLAVARDLIGVKLVRKIGDKKIVATIIETEAYVGPHDLASHSSKNRTSRTEVMYGPPGIFYVYFVYGMHWMLNVVTEPAEFPAGVLIRGVEIEGNRVSGPGRVTKILKIDGNVSGKPASPKSGLWFEKKPADKRPKIARTPRIGVNYSGPVWSAKPYRFVLDRPQPRTKPVSKSS